MANTRASQQTEERRGPIYSRSADGGVQLASGPDRWLVHDDFVHLAPAHEGRAPMYRFDADLKPFVESPARMALVVIDMQNDFCAPGGWTDASGLDYEGCRKSIPGIERTIGAARELGIQVIWLYWHNRPDLRNVGAPTLYSFKHDPSQKGIGEASARGQILTVDSWGAEIVAELKDHVRDEDLHVWKFRMSGFWGTHLDQILRTQGYRTLLFTGVNVDQCVTSTMQDAYFRDYNCALVEDAASTSSPDYCKDAVVFNTKNCWGFVTTSGKLASARELKGSPQ